MTVYQFCRQMKYMYAQVNTLLGNYTYVAGMPPSFNPYNTTFIDAICKQAPIDELVEKLKTKTQEAKEVAEQFEEDFRLKYGFKYEFTYEGEEIKILRNSYYISEEDKLKLESITRPFRHTYLTFCNLVEDYKDKESPNILGNNWKLQKIFKNQKTTKAKEINKAYVLNPDVVDEIINNYFLYIKCGWNPNEDYKELWCKQIGM